MLGDEAERTDEAVERLGHHTGGHIVGLSSMKASGCSFPEWLSLYSVKDRHAQGSN